MIFFILIFVYVILLILSDMTSVEQNTIVYIKRDADEGTSQLWMLVEYRPQNHSSKLKNYEVVDARDVCGTNGRGNSAVEKMHTGNLIFVKKDNGYAQATIVTISDDKHFLDTELNDLLDLQKGEEQNQKKRKRSVATKENGTSPQTSYQRWNGGSNSIDASTSAHSGQINKQSVIISNPNVQNYPPMTFDQQTQTDFKSNSEFASTEMRLTKILVTEENIMRDVHSMSVDNHEMKQQVADLRAEVAEVKTILKDIAGKLTNQTDGGVHSTSVDFNRSGSSMLNSTQTSTTVLTRTPQVNAPRILNLSHQSNYSPQTLHYNSISIEPVIEASNDSNFSYSNHSRMSLSASNQSIYQADTNHNDSAQMTVCKLEYSNNGKGESYADDEGDPNEEVVIGSNNTTVPRNVLMNINWNSHTAATRRLLRAKFTREVLATHSLTGKPSPGMYCARLFKTTASKTLKIKFNRIYYKFMFNFFVSFLFLFYVANHQQQLLLSQVNQPKIN